MKNFRKSGLLFLLALLVANCVYSQTDDAKVTQNYQEALDKYDEGDYLGSCNLLIEAQTLLGGTNLTIQPLYIASCFRLKHWKYTKDAIEKYYTLGPDTTTEHYKSMILVQNFVDSMLLGEETDYRTFTGNPSNDLYSEFEDNYPYSDKLVTMKNTLADKEQEKYWNMIKDAESALAFKTFIELYPYGKYTAQARKIFAELEDKTFKNARDKNTVTAYKEYLEAYPDGKNAAFAELYLDVLYDDNAFRAVGEKTEFEDELEAAEKYMEDYPAGRHFLEVYNSYTGNVLSAANEFYKIRNYEKAIDWYNKYLNKKKYFADLNNRNSVWSTQVEEPANDDFVQRRINQCNRILNQKGMELLALSINTNSALGFSIESMSVTGMGYFVQATMNKTLLYGYDTEYTIDNAGNKYMDNDVTLTDEVRNGEISINAGLNFKLFYPVWINVGAGVGYFPVYRIAKNSAYDYEDYLKNTDLSGIRLYPLVGLNLKLSDTWALKYNATYCNGVVHQIGIGIDLR